ncbi:MAG: ribosome recycling factor, partial [Candidatus Omnitrophica bacterium]|nr:ribosome recycling factor [Candidatus Omnitrophota bacterium]
MTVKEVLKDTEATMKKTIEAARREFSEVRTGRAHPGVIEGLHVNYYGELTLLKAMANISIPDPKTIMIQPWDPTAIPEIEKAIETSKLGITPSNDGKNIRLNVPPLSDERRQELIKIVKDMAEKSRVSLRTIRRDANDQIKKLESDKLVSEDDGRKAHDEIQKLTDRYVKEVDQLLDEKSKQLT